MRSWSGSSLRRILSGIAGCSARNRASTPGGQQRQHVVDTDPDRAARGVPPLEQPRAQLRHLVERGARALQELRTERGRDHPPTGPLEQPLGEALRQIEQLLAQGRLRDADLGGSAGRGAGGSDALVRDAWPKKLALVRSSTKQAFH